MQAGTSNPCDERGEVILCEKCQQSGRHRRERDRMGRPGVVYLMGIRGQPVLPVLAETVEVLCAEHHRDMGQPRRFREHLKPTRYLTPEEVENLRGNPSPVEDFLERL